MVIKEIIESIVIKESVGFNVIVVKKIEFVKSKIDVS